MPQVMNVFLIDDTPQAVAQALDDKRLFKQAVECCQMLAASLEKKGIIIYRLDDDGFKVPVMSGNIGNHPATLWVEHSREAFKFTYNLAVECIREHQYRFGSKSGKLIYQLGQIKPHITEVSFPSEHTQWWPTMPLEDERVAIDRCWSPNTHWPLTMKVYRLHYGNKKPLLSGFTKRMPPKWLIDW